MSDRGFRRGQEIEEKIFVGALGGLHSTKTFKLLQRYRGAPPGADRLLRAFGPTTSRQRRAIWYWTAQDLGNDEVVIFREMDLVGYSYFDEDDKKSKHYVYDTWS